MTERSKPVEDGGRFARPVVLGAGPVGSAVVQALLDRAHEPSVVTRSGSAVPGATAVAADLSDPAAAATALADATIVFSTVQPAYHRWVQEFPALQASIVAACQTVDVPLMVVENLYGYGPHDGPLRESTPMRPTTKKGTVRTEMWRALEAAAANGLDMAVVRASDFIGPGVEGSAFGDRFFAPLAKGKPTTTIGNLDALHSVTFVPDLAEALVRVAEDEASWGRAWHAPSAPAVTQRHLAQMAAHAIGAEAQIKTTPIWLLRMVGPFIKAAGETVEMAYEFDSDFVVDSSAFTEYFGMDATPLDRSIAAVMAPEVSTSERAAA